MHKSWRIIIKFSDCGLRSIAFHVVQCNNNVTLYFVDNLSYKFCNMHSQLFSFSTKESRRLSFKSKYTYLGVLAEKDVISNTTEKVNIRQFPVMKSGSTSLYLSSVVLLCPYFYCRILFNAVGVSYLSTLKYVADKHDAVDIYNLRTLFGFPYKQFTSTKKILHEYLWFFIVNSINRFHPIKPALIGWYLSSTSSIIINDVLVC